MNDTGGIKKTISDLQNEEIENRLCLMHDIRGGLDAGGELIGYVYRINQDKSRTALPPVNEFLMDADFGLIHGPGSYNVSYFQRTDSNNVLKPLKTISYKIGREFIELHKNFCAENNIPCYLIENNSPVNGPQTGLINYLDSDKLKAAAGFLGALKLILAPEGGAGSNLNIILEQNKELIKNLAAPRENISESIVNQAFKMLAAPNARNEQPQQLDIFEQAKNFKAMKDLFSDETKSEADPADTMHNKMIEKAMENLPALLDLFKGHIPSAAKHLKKSKPFEAAALRLNPKLQADFYSAISAKFGTAAAQIWAKEYGINPNNLIPFKPAAGPAQEVQPVQVQEQTPQPEKLKKVVF